MIAHQFSFFIYALSKSNKNIPFSLEEEGIVHRLKNVLRLHPGESIVLFNRELQATFEIREFLKKSIQGTLGPCLPHQKNDIRKVTVFLPLLKKEHLSEALYGLCEVGVAVIQLVYTNKAHIKTWSSKDQEKAEKIIIAAAEQSKNFAFPVLRAPISLEDACMKISSAESKIVFDVDGQNFFKLHAGISQEQPVSLFLGPEADFSDQEKKLFEQYHVQKCKLTPTILRAYQAAIIGAALWILD